MNKLVRNVWKEQTAFYLIKSSNLNTAKEPVHFILKTQSRTELQVMIAFEASIGVDFCT